MQSLCETCTQMKEVISGKGSRFLLCWLAQQDRRFQKYPQQPVVRCAGYQPASLDRTGLAHTPQATVNVAFGQNSGPKMRNFKDAGVAVEAEFVHADPVVHSAALFIGSAAVVQEPPACSLLQRDVESRAATEDA